MTSDSSRRGFLAASLATPLAAAAPPAQRKLEMPYRRLGKTGLKVSVLGFGCMTTTDPTVLEQAADIGVNYFDTARGYQQGNNERMVGAALKTRRDRLVISSKSAGKTAAEARAHLDTTLKELGVDHIDIWYLHAKAKPEDVPDELLDVQDEAVKAGKVRFRGVSTHAGMKELVPYLIAKGRTDVLLTSYNFTMEPWMEDCLDQLKRANIGVVAMKVMAGGFRRIKPGDALHGKFQKEGAMASALKWAVRRPEVHTSIPGIMDLDQLDENFQAVCGKFEEKDRQILARQMRDIAPLYCRMCGTCTGTCAKGLPVSDIVRYMSYLEGYGQFGLARENFQSLPAELREVRCSDCAECSVRCPNGVQIVQRLSRAQEVLA
jgi:aryl-alcohol dehydrogenase-like predicted oxidoreductase